MTKEMIFGLVGGLAVFLYGMGLMSDGLKMVAGNRLRRMLGAMTGNRILGVTTGAGVTTLIQSSSATTVIVVGLINAGLLTLAQAISVILGANIGTTVTAWLVSWAVGLKALKISSYALMIIAMGFGMHTFGKRQNIKTIGQVLLGLGLLFIGLNFMKEAFGDLSNKENSPLIQYIIMVGDRPLLAILAGAAFTMVIQSSSASIAMVMVAVTSSTQLTDDPANALRVAIPFILGDNIGTTITAQLAAIRSNIAGKRAAMAHTMFNVLGVAVVLPMVYTGFYARAVEWLYVGPLTSATLVWHIAMAHTAFNVTATIVMIPFIGVLARIVERVLPSKKGDMESLTVVLEEHLLDTPPLAMDQVRREMVRMIRAARRAVEIAVQALRENQLSQLKDVERYEEATDHFQTEITGYLVSLSQRSLDKTVSNELPVLLHSVNDIERIGDHALNIAEIASRKFENRHKFGPDAENELDRMLEQLESMFSHVEAAIEKSDKSEASKAIENEGAINQMDHEFRRNHTRRLSTGDCQPLIGLIFVDYLQNMEKIGDHLANIAQGIIADNQWDPQSDLQLTNEEEIDTILADPQETPAAEE